MHDLKKGAVLRLSKFTNVSEDGNLETSWNVNKGKRGKDKQVLAAVLVSTQPFVMNDETAELMFMNIKTELEILGYVSVEDIEKYAKGNVGAVGKLFNKLVNAEVKKRLKAERTRR